MSTIASLLETLADKGTPDDIAAFLTAEGVKGHRINPCHCPVAVWLAGRITNDGIMSGPPVIRSTVVEWYDTEPRVTSVPGVVREFISLFDQGRYPKLIKVSEGHPGYGW